jgi:MazG family protein
MSINPSPLLDLVAIVARLRSKDGCPWDQKQTLASMRPYLLEEVYELLDAMEHASGEDGLEGELGDTLFVLLLITQIAAEQGLLSLDSVARRIVTKMIDRHPHVFGDGDESDDPGGIAAWEARKQRSGRGRLDGVPRSLPALLRAHRQGEKAAAVGFDWPDVQGVLNKVEEELIELREAISTNDGKAIAHELGDVLMSVASLGRHLETPPESALRTANDRFAQRFAQMERLAVEQGIPLTGSTDDALLNQLWEQAKAMERQC